MNEILIINTGLVPVITAVVEAIKRAGMKSDFAPIASVLTGIVFSTVVHWATLPAYDARAAVLGALAGVLSGLAASGLYSGVKTPVNEPVAEISIRSAKKS